METRKTLVQRAAWLSCLMALVIVLGCCVPTGMAEEEETPGEPQKCPHENTETAVAETNFRDYTDYGDGTHSFVYDRTTTVTCKDCGGEVSSTTEVGLTGYEAHEGDPCSKCGWESCKHLHTKETTSWTDAVYKPNGDGQTHSVTARYWSTVTCLDCGEELSVTDLGEQTRDGWHSYTEDGKTCIECGYENTCTHPNFIEGEENRENIVLTPNGDGKTHTCTYDQVLVSYCPDCEWWSKIERTGEKTVVEPHEYVDGVCACGAKEPEATATPAPTRTPAPVKTSAPSGGNSGGTTTVTQPETDVEFIATPEPAPTAAPEMVSTLLDTVAQAEAEGSEVRVEVVGAQEVFSDTEYEQLKTLPAQEQMLVTLASIGLEDVVQAALASMDVTLSSEAEALTAQVAERFAAMDEEERAQVEEKLTQLFPKTEVTVGDVTYEYFVIDLQIVVDGKVRVERYGFRYDEELGQWVFEKLDLVDMYVEAE